MSGLNQSFLSKQKLSSIIFIIVFLAHFSVLYINTPVAEFEWLEALKLFGPMLTLATITLFSNATRLMIIKYGLYILSLHIMLSVCTALINGPANLFSEDGRLVVSLLGRGSGETAWALCVLLVTTNFLRDQNRISIKPSTFMIIALISILAIIFTQTRSALLFLSVYFIYRGGYKLKFRFAIILLLVALFVVILSVGAAPIFPQFINRSLSTETLLTGREYIWAAQMMALASQDMNAILIGSDLIPKIHEVAEISYATADPHNLFIDIFQYYGLLGLGYIYLWYRNMIKDRCFSASSLLIAFFIMSLFVSTVRYPLVFYVNILLLLAPTIRSCQRAKKPINTSMHFVFRNRFAQGSATLGRT